MVSEGRFRRHAGGAQAGPAGLRVRELRVRPSATAHRFHAGGRRRAIGPQYPARRVPALHPRLVPDHPRDTNARSRCPGAGRAVGFVRGRGAHRVHGRRRQVSDHRRCDAHRYRRDSRGDEGHRADRSDEPVAVLGVRHDPGHDAGAARQRGGDILLPDPVLSFGRPGVPAGAPDHVRATLPLRATMTADRRTGGRAGATAGLAAVFLNASPPDRLTAQDSQFGIRGLGTPGRWESVRSRSSGGAFAPFDALSPLIDAPLGDIRRMSASITTGTSWRSVAVDSGTSSLRGTRFPALVLAGPAMRRIIIGGGFSTYLDRTFGILTHDTIVLRGVPQPITDLLRSDGAVTDLRIAAASRVTSWLTLGVGFHLLTGSTRMVATRTFTDTAYRTSSSRDEVAYSGKGGSFSALIDLSQDLRVAGWYRDDSKLRADLNGRTAAENDLPPSYGAGIQWRV